MSLPSEADIINTACALIGEDPVENLLDDGGNGQKASLLYNMVVKFNLGLQPSGFSFAREVRQLSLLADVTPLSGYQFAFAIPGPYNGLPIYLSDDPTDPSRRFTAYILANRQVHSSCDPLFAMVKFQPTPDRWTDTFAAATVHGLAAKLAWSISSDRNSHDRLNELAYGTAMDGHRGGMMRAAINEDGFANPPRPASFDNNPLTNSWRG